MALTISERYRIPELSKAYDLMSQTPLVVVVVVIILFVQIKQDTLMIGHFTVLLLFFKSLVGWRV